MYKMIFAGFGGQGIQSMGQFMAYAAMKENKEVSYFPAYGPEMRGGTSNCHVVVSENKIASPLCFTPDVLVAMNVPSLIKFENSVAKGGYILINSSLIDYEVKRKDIKVVKIKANELAESAGTSKAANMVMTGALNKLLKLVTDESIKIVTHEKFGHKQSLVETNEKAYALGQKSVEKV